jgi:hypothetical protein
VGTGADGLRTRAALFARRCLCGLRAATGCVYGLPSLLSSHRCTLPRCVVTQQPTTHFGASPPELPPELSQGLEGSEGATAASAITAAADTASAIIPAAGATADAPSS